MFFKVSTNNGILNLAVTSVLASYLDPPHLQHTYMAVLCCVPCVAQAGLLRDVAQN